MSDLTEYEAAVEAAALASDNADLLAIFDAYSAHYSGELLRLTGHE